MLNPKIKKILLALVPILLVGLGIVGTITITSNEDGSVEIKTEATLLGPNADVEYSSEQVNAQVDETVTEEPGEIPTVEVVDGGQITDCPEESEECAKGAALPALDITSPATFYNSVIDQCLDFDGAYGSQCYDEMAYFHFIYTGRWLSTNGTGAAYGIWDAREYNNPINSETGETYYEFITDPAQLKAGDFIVFTGGQYGHVGAAVGSYNNGYITLLGTNQGGRACAGGGSAANVINISLANFRGAFRPRIWIEKEPEAPAIPVTGCSDWDVVEGDTMSKIMLECENTVVYGEPMNEYAKTWYSQKINPGQSVYYGWTHGTGYGLYAGDYLLHETEK